LVSEKSLKKDKKRKKLTQAKYIALPASLPTKYIALPASLLSGLNYGK